MRKGSIVSICKHLKQVHVRLPFGTYIQLRLIIIMTL